MTTAQYLGIEQVPEHMRDENRVETPLPFLRGPFPIILPLFQVVEKQEAGEEEEPAHGDGAKEMRNHLRKEMEDIGSVHGPKYGGVVRPDRMFVEHQDDEWEAHRLDEFGLAVVKLLTCVSNYHVLTLF